MEIDLTQEKYVEVYAKLRKAYLEFQGHQNVIFYMVENKLNNTDGYQAQWDAYLESLMDYNNLKKAIEEVVIYPETDNKGGTWSVDFSRDIVKVDVND